MKTFKNRFGELQTNWESTKHPDNANFMQIVKYMHIQYPDGRNNLHWSLFNNSSNDKHIIANITLEKAKELYSDSVDIISEEMFNQWIIEKNK